ncbi:MAG: ATP-binding protein [Lachnospirales bacterium]
MGIKKQDNIFDKVKNSINNGIDSGAVLTPRQVEEINKRRKEYLDSVPNMDSDKSSEIVSRNIGAISVEIYQAYLEKLKVAYLPIDINIVGIEEINRIRYFDITKWVTDKEEKSLDKLSNVYQVLNEDDCNIALIYNRTKEKCNITLAVVNTNEEQSDPNIIRTYNERLLNAIYGNFPGVEIKVSSKEDKDFGYGIPENLKSASHVVNEENEVKSVAIVSNLASEKSEGFVSQSMEKLLDGIVPKNKSEEYTIILLAKPVCEQMENKNRLFDLYTQLSPYASWQTNFTCTEGENVGNGYAAGGNVGLGVGTPMESPVNVNANFGANFSRTTNVSVNLSKNQGLTQTYTNYGVKHTLEVIENQMKRLEETTALGMWEFAAYIVSESPVIANNVAHMYLALTQGEQSYMSKATVNLWNGERETIQAKTILEYVQRLQHPLFHLCKSDDWLLYPTLVTPSAILSGKELAKSLNFPNKSVSGLPVIESTAFGREVQKFENDLGYDKRVIDIGNIYHMRRKEESKVCLDVDSFASHVFVTGSTGTGKSNVVYQLLDNLRNQEVNFLVIEPAKGEYKKVFGAECKVYGTNTKKSELLRINPFSFPSDIHVLEHIDRLIEIFNACWPMYAAMPAILKDAVEKSYKKVGWDLVSSKCKPIAFPTFDDILTILPEILDNSMFSNESKGDYKGALVTRVQSLTNGINGQILCSKIEQSNEELFKQNVIIDLSRASSSETKALLMGILVMKLQEYRMHLDKMNETLVHVTVLEEAHNLLRRTSTTQSAEGANLQGKAVEMLTNSIAEMRTYGQGFIIADQAPELLDESVIRNTNTKIILRLPSESDRKLVGTSMALNENQITELAKLPRGIAAVYQNNWVEAVLCNFEKYGKISPLEYECEDITSTLEKFFTNIFLEDKKSSLSSKEKEIVDGWIHSLNGFDKTKDILIKVLTSNWLENGQKDIIAYDLFKGKKIATTLKDCIQNKNSVEETNEKINNIIKNNLIIDTNNYDLIDTLRISIIKSVLNILKNMDHENIMQFREFYEINKIR